MPNLPFQYVTSLVLVTVHANGIEWMEKGVVSNGPKEFVPASEVAGVVEERGGVVSQARLEIRFKNRSPLALTAQLGERGKLYELKEAVQSILR